MNKHQQAPKCRLSQKITTKSTQRKATLYIEREWQVVIQGLTTNIQK